MYEWGGHGESLGDVGVMSWAEDWCVLVVMSWRDGWRDVDEDRA